MEEALGTFLAWLTAQAMHSGKPPLRCTPDLLDAYVRCMLLRVRPATAHNRVRHLEVALDVLGLNPDRALFCKTCRFLRRLERKAVRHVAPPTPAKLRALGIKLMRLAEAAPEERVRAVTFRDGLIIAALAHRPLRRTNVAELLHWHRSCPKAD